jgi:IS30 family transposase
MCLLNYNKKEGKYKHLTYAERTMIETWYNSDKKSKREIAELLHKSERTIRREIKRGKIIIRDYDWSEKEEYSARKAQDAYEYGKTGKGPELNWDQDMELVRHIEKEIIRNKKSPEVVSKQLKENGFDIEICGRTIRNGIKSGIIFDKLKQGKIIYKKEYNNKHYKWHKLPNNIQNKNTNKRHSNNLCRISHEQQANQRKIPDQARKRKGMVIHNRPDIGVCKNLQWIQSHMHKHLRHLDTSALPTLTLRIQLIHIFNRVNKKDGFFSFCMLYCISVGF